MRRPDFIVIGAMKAGTTTLFRRLGRVPGVELPSIKEPHFFSRSWDMGQDWYRSVFAECEGITGESSVSYSDARDAALVAERMASLLPDVRLIYALRDPAARLRSHYRHQVLRGRERRVFEEAVGDAASEYVASSLYGVVIESYLGHYDPAQLMVFDIGELNEDQALWPAILRHIGADDAPMPDESHNVSEEKRQYTRPMLWLWEKGIDVPAATPRWLRDVAKRALTRDSTRTDLLQTSDGPLPASVLQTLEQDMSILKSTGVKVASAIPWATL